MTASAKPEDSRVAGETASKDLAAVSRADLSATNNEAISSSETAAFNEAGSGIVEVETAEVTAGISKILWTVSEHSPYQRRAHLIFDKGTRNNELYIL